MDFLYLKIVLLLNGWLLALGSSVAMLQQATSSQSIVFHQSQASPPAAVTTISSPDASYGGVQPKYEYKYEVSDHQTGDRKSHWESREGDRVRGGYTLYEPDGALRTVEYSADSVHGFNAVVRRNEATRHHQHPRSEIYHRGASSSPNDRYNAGDHSGYIADKDVFTIDHEKDHPRYSGPTASHNAVEFSVNHVLALREEESVEPF